MEQFKTNIIIENKIEQEVKGKYTVASKYDTGNNLPDI